MTAVLIGQAEVESPEWHALRAGGIGGSEIAAVMGLSRWSSPFQTWHRKRGNLPGQKPNEAMDWGHRLEPAIAQRFIDDHPELSVTRTPGTYAHHERGWQRINPDGLVDENALLEVKNASAYADDFTKEDIPLEYHCQVQHAMDIFEVPRCYVAVLIGGNHYREYVIEADAEDQANLRNTGAAFWQSVQTDEEPPLDCSHHTYEAIRDLNPLIDRDLIVNLTPEQWGDYLKAKADLDQAESDITFAKSHILQAMGQARVARFAERDVLRRQMSSAKTPYLKEIAS